ncbi:hypothetical protein GcM1_247148 [Golovinomyces cichoracearum]|uniref:Uncharacterized protein n=1 Tax=Golovinomyces cichoracearum TaxID=62708 RepID=A0A420IDW3_9PEZI|nr:hypothetical protein GcM1_247148 [Golovinomyces cichoracearum]
MAVRYKLEQMIFIGHVLSKDCTQNAGYASHLGIRGMEDQVAKRVSVQVRSIRSVMENHRKIRLSGYHREFLKPYVCLR